MDNMHLSTQKRELLEHALRQALSDLRYGSVEIIVHNAQVVQVERLESFRPDTQSPTATPAAEAVPTPN